MTAPAIRDPGLAPEGGARIDDHGELREEHVRALRLGSGANCSSVGSVVDTLFATAAVGAAVFAGVLAALGREDVRGRRAHDAAGARRTPGDGSPGRTGAERDRAPRGSTPSPGEEAR